MDIRNNSDERYTLRVVIYSRHAQTCPKLYKETLECQIYLNLEDANLEYRIKKFQTKQNELKSLYFLNHLGSQKQDALTSNFPQKNCWALLPFDMEIQMCAWNPHKDLT